MDNLSVHLTKQPCERKSSSHQLSFLGSWRGESLTKTNKRKTLFAVILAVAISLSASLTKTFRVNSRLYVGLILTIVVAPLASCFYTLFDRTANLPLSPETIALLKAGRASSSDYYVNSHYFFAGVGPHISFLIVLIGLALYFYKDSKIDFVWAAPIGYAAAKIYWLCNVISDDEFNQPVYWAIVLVVVLLTAVIIGSFKFWMDRKFHKYDGNLKTYEGLVKLKGMIPEEERLALMEKVLLQIRNFN